jgi:dimeric dUTPase (all-alpha-NTP-PPase superfamily)
MKVSSVGLGWRGTYAALLNEVRCFPYHGKKDASDTEKIEKRVG